MQAAILRLGRHLGQAEKIASTADDFRRYGFGPDAAFSGFIAEIDGAFAGLCLYFPIFSTWLGRPGVFVQDLYVDETFRGQRVGETLLRAVAAWSRQRGGVYLRLAVDTANVPAQAFYERVGIGWLEEDRDHGAYGAAFLALAGNDDT
ncbi:GNAT family N-acetyltransferase [Rhizobiaceae bacterium n13]|uniref:GNAT family N-acetyltransferase n=1 Tax=Ferirhizobium litorale TaxID=2927786 RepID=A0AAE3QGJ3_9HYPH|nr:GNAT family N-acetyltransferase [Fererhizobium litorale]MDI7864459.1 GNAT family N-acetyltransferase [Fererhizobium litorale]MDI7924790.1 GNAT family N-acetyltransferase [Fererhizobium litorale]